MMTMMPTKGASRGRVSSFWRQVKFSSRRISTLSPQQPGAGLLAAELDHHPDDEQRGEQQAGTDTGDEQLADRLLGDDAIEDQGQRGRDQDAQRAAGRDDAGRQSGRIAALAHLGNARGTDRRTGGGTRSAHRGEHRAGHHVGGAEAAGDASHPAVERGIQVAAGARLADCRAHQDEQRNGQQDEIVELRIQGFGDQPHGFRRHVEQHEDQRHRAHRERDRHSGKQRNEGGDAEQDAYLQGTHSSSSLC